MEQPGPCLLSCLELFTSFLVCVLGVGAQGSLAPFTLCTRALDLNQDLNTSVGHSQS